MRLKAFIEFELSKNDFELLENFGVEEISTQLMKELSKRDDISGLYDEGLWLDVGHYFKCQCGNTKFNTFLAKYSEDEPWQLSIELEKYPSIFTKLLAKDSGGFVEDLKKLTTYIFSEVSSGLSPKSINVCISSDTNKQVRHPSELNW